MNFIYCLFFIFFGGLIDDHEVGDDFWGDAYFDFEVLQFDASFFEGGQGRMDLFGELNDFVVAHVPEGLHCFLHWFLRGGGGCVIGVRESFHAFF